jgi:hypothetical protein
MKLVMGMRTLKSEGKRYTNRLLGDTAYGLRLVDFAAGRKMAIKYRYSPDFPPATRMITA